MASQKLDDFPPPLSVDPRKFVFVHRPRCPECGSAWLLTQRSFDNGDGSRTRPTICRDCGERFRVVIA